jgi:hypothetical protein
MSLEIQVSICISRLLFKRFEVRHLNSLFSGLSCAGGTLAQRDYPAFTKTEVAEYKFDFVGTLGESPGVYLF